MDLEEKLLKLISVEIARAKEDLEKLEAEPEGVNAVIELFDILAA